MIRTRYKTKLSNILSYPIGAAALTEELADAPHAESFTISFHGKPVRSASRFQRILADKQPYTILATKYDPAHKPGYSSANFLVESGWYDEKWELVVYPVIRKLRHLANRLLHEQGLPLIVEWLRSSEEAGWLGRQQELELIFSPTEESIGARKKSGV